MEHRLHETQALRDHSYCRKSNNISKSDGVLLLKDCDYYPVQRRSQQDANDKRAHSSVTIKVCGCRRGGHTSASCADKTVAIVHRIHNKTHTNKVINLYS